MSLKELEPGIKNRMKDLLECESKMTNLVVPSQAHKPTARLLRWMLKENVAHAKYYLRLERDGQVYRLNSQGHSVADIAVRVGVSKSTVRRKIKSPFTGLVYGKS